MNALVGCIDFKDLFFFSFLQLPSRRFKAVVGVKSPHRVGGVCEQKVGEYLIADLLTRPVLKAFSCSGLFLFFKGRGPLVIPHLLSSCSYVHTVCGAARL